MYYKVLEKYSTLKSKHQFIQEEQNKTTLKLEEELHNEFMNIYDKDVKIIHSNQKIIENNLNSMFKETEKLIESTKTATNLYDDFVEYLKEAGDVYNWCNLIQEDLKNLNETLTQKLSK